MLILTAGLIIFRCRGACRHAGQSGRGHPGPLCGLPAIDGALLLFTSVWGGRGRLIYMGAGTSARIGVQDGAELLPTDFPPSVWLS